MRRLAVFNNVSLDGFFVDANGDMSWAHQQDPEWNEFAAQNASGNGELVFGRVTYDIMAAFWPSPAAAQMMPTVAEGMNRMRKWVFSRSMESAAWQNSTVVRGDMSTEMRRIKEDSGPDLVILGSGTIVAQCAAAGLIEEYQIVVHPIVLGRGRTLFEGLEGRLNLKLTLSRTFANGNLFVCYVPA